MIEGTQGQDQVIEKPKAKLPIKLIVSLLAIVTLAVFAMPTLKLWYDSTPKIDAEKLRTAQVKRGDLIRDVAVSGKIVAANPITSNI